MSSRKLTDLLVGFGLLIVCSLAYSIISQLPTATLKGNREISIEVTGKSSFCIITYGNGRHEKFPEKCAPGKDKEPNVRKVENTFSFTFLGVTGTQTTCETTKEAWRLLSVGSAFGAPSYNCTDMEDGSLIREALNTNR